MRQLLLQKILISCLLLVLVGCQEPTQKQVDSPLASSPAQKPADPNLPPPEIQFENISLDFGQVGPATMQTRELKFKNVGEGPLVIKDVLLCCGVVAETDKREYAPGETGTFKIDFQAPGSVGVFERKPVLYTNDPVNPEITFLLTCDVVQKVVWDPEKIKMLLNAENAACPKLTIKCIDEQPFAIIGVRSTGNCVTADYNPTVKKTEHVLDLKVDIDKLPEQMYGEIVVKMNHPEGNIATIFFDVVPKYTLSPKPLYLYRMQEGESQKATIKIINNYKDDIEIESTSSKENTIKLVNKKKDEFDYELQVEVTPPPITDGEIRFNDIFYINLSNGEQLALKCTGYYED